jgi:hypothetical protein
MKEGSFDFFSAKYCMSITGVVTNSVCKTRDATILDVEDYELAFEMAHVTRSTEFDEDS